MSTRTRVAAGLPAGWIPQAWRRWWTCHRDGGVLAPGSAEAVAERKKASVRKEAGHPFLVISRQFGDMKARYRRLAKNGSHLVTLFALSNLSMAPRALGGWPPLPTCRRDWRLPEPASPTDPWWCPDLWHLACRRG